MEALARSASAFGDLHARLTCAQQLPTSKDACYLSKNTNICCSAAASQMPDISARERTNHRYLWARTRVAHEPNNEWAKPAGKRRFAAAQRSLDAVIKADPNFYPAYYIRAEVFLNQRKYQEAIQD